MFIATALDGGLQSHRPEMVDGGLIVGIDRFMSEARALTNFAGNAVATVIIGSWTKQVDWPKVRQVLAGQDPFDEKTLLDDHGAAAEPSESNAEPSESNAEVSGANAEAGADGRAVSPTRECR